MMAVYTCTNSTAGSFMVISMGLISASRAMARNLMLRWSISLCDMKRGFPVSLRTRLARRSRMLGELVSGRNMNMSRATGAEAQMDSKRDQRQDSAGTAKPLRRGPRAAEEGDSDG